MSGVLLESLDDLGEGPLPSCMGLVRGLAIGDRPTGDTEVG